MTGFELFIVAAVTIAGPVIAVQTQKFIERTTQRRNDQKHVFYLLMATRAPRLANEHVQALNRIELEFGGHSAKERLCASLGGFARTS